MIKFCHHFQKNHSIVSGENKKYSHFHSYFNKAYRLLQRARQCWAKTCNKHSNIPVPIKIRTGERTTGQETKLGHRKELINLNLHTTDQ